LEEELKNKRKVIFILNKKNPKIFFV